MRDGSPKNSVLVQMLCNKGKASGRVIASQKPVIHLSRAVISLIRVVQEQEELPLTEHRRKPETRRGYLTCLCASGNLITAWFCLCHVRSQPLSRISVLKNKCRTSPPSTHSVFHSKTGKNAFWRWLAIPPCTPQGESGEAFSGSFLWGLTFSVSITMEIHFSFPASHPVLLGSRTSPCPCSGRSQGNEG